MTIEDLLRVVREETGKEATADSKLSDLVADSLEFANLIARVTDEFGDFPEEAVSRLDTVEDLFDAVLMARTHD